MWWITTQIIGWRGVKRNKNEKERGAAREGLDMGGGKMVEGLKHQAPL